jgi:hypothetical protein
MSRPPDVPTAAELIEKVAALQRRPAALQALWDGDSTGWMVCLEVVVESSGVYEDSLLALLRLGGDICVFQGVVPPWPEAALATELGTALANHFAVPFWFPSPTEPDHDCPRWSERSRAHPCEDCSKLILPPKTPYRPVEICHACNRRRSVREDLRADEPADPDGVTALLVNGQDEEWVGYSSAPMYMPVAWFATHVLGRAEEARATGELFLAGDDVLHLEQHLRTEVQRMLDAFDRRAPDRAPAVVGEHCRVVFEGRELDLDIHFDNDAYELYAAIDALDTARRAVRDGLRFWLVFRHGMTTRTDRVLRVLLQLDGESTVSALAKRCERELRESEVRAAIARLAEMGHVLVDHDIVRLTRRGRHVL